MIVSLIAAATENNVIGSNNQLPWNLPVDMKYFKNVTWGMPVIMGRKTFESMDGKPLPGRINIVITRQLDFASLGAVVANSYSDALEIASGTDCKEVFVIGGGQIFEDMIQQANKIYLTRIHAFVEGDAYFPNIDDTWRCTSSRRYEKDDKHAYDLSFQVWEKL